MPDVNRQVSNIFEEICAEKRGLRVLEKKYADDYKGVLNVFKSFMDLAFNNEKLTLKRRINAQRELVASKENDLYLNSLVSLDKTCMFFADVITEIENVPYVYRKFDLEDDIFRVMPTLTSDFEVMFAGEETVGVIAREALFDGLEGVFCDESGELADFLKKQNEKFVMVDAASEERNIALLENMEAPRYLVDDFPYLEKVCTDIVAMRINNPTMSLEDIYSGYLHNLRKNKKGVVNRKKLHTK